MEEIKYGKVENGEATVEDFANFSENQQNDRRINERKGQESALKKARAGAKRLVESSKSSR